MKKLLRTLPFLTAALVLLAAPIYQAFAGINRPSYRYTEALCTEGRLAQKEKCQSLSAEGLVYRLHRALVGSNPANPLYTEQVKKLVVDQANPLLLANLLVTQSASGGTTQDYLTSLYGSLQCNNAPSQSIAITQWKAQIDASKQTRAQVALYLAKQKLSINCMAPGFKTFIDATPAVDLGPSDPVDPPDPVTLDDVAVSCNVVAGAQGCSVAAPQYCLNTVLTQPAHGSSAVSNGQIIYTRSGTSTATEHYSHLRQNGTVTAECTVTVTLETVVEPPSGNVFHVAVVGANFGGLAAESDFNTVFNSYKNALITDMFNPVGLASNQYAFHTAVTSDTLGCQGGIPVGQGGNDEDQQRRFLCDNSLVDSIVTNRSLPADRIIVIYNAPGTYGGAAEPSGRHSYFTSGTGGFVIAHELGHSLGLVDEYIYHTGAVSNPSSLGKVQGQCLYPYDSSPLYNGTWRTTPGIWTQWKDLPNVEWMPGCGFDAWSRPSLHSMMREVGYPFNSVSLEVLKNSIANPAIITPDK